MAVGIAFGVPFTPGSRYTDLGGALLLGALFGEFGWRRYERRLRAGLLGMASGMVGYIISGALFRWFG